MIHNDAVIFGILTLLLALVFVTSHSQLPFFKRFYGVVPTVLMCYFLPSLLNSFGLVDAEQSNLYFVASRYLLPACLVLLTLSIDLPAMLRLGPKALILFFTGTIGIIIGGPITVLLVSYIEPSYVGGVGPNAVWRGMTTIAGTWIGGSANQVAMKEVFEVSDKLFSVMVTVDVLMANLWMAVLLIMAGKSTAVDRWLHADSSVITQLKDKVSAYQAKIARIPDLNDLIKIMAVGFGVTAIAHGLADVCAPWVAENMPQLSRFNLSSKFFWLVVIATTLGVLLSFTKVRRLEGAGASKIGSAFIYILIATIGLKMDVLAITKHPELFLIGFIWITFHAVLLIIVCRLIRAPVFFLAVGSMANVGGAASAPVMASAFHPSLAPVGVLLAVFGYALGTYGAWLCGQLMRIAAS